MFEGLFDLLNITNGWDVVSAVIDITLIYLLVYQVLLLIRGTRAVQMVLGLSLLIIFFFLSKDEYLGLQTIHWALEKFMGAIIVVIVVLFQGEIRRGLFKFGRNRIFGGTTGQEETYLSEELVRACTKLSEERIGALIAIDREVDLTRFTEEAIEIDARTSHELLYAIFNPANRNPLHDGAVIILEGRIAAAGCFVPLTSNPRIDKSLGTRHRAGIGLSEDTSAVVLIVSEETGIISVAIGGELRRRLDANALRTLLQAAIGAKSSKNEKLLEEIKDKRNASHSDKGAGE
jgi:uncharacterized protein (TIGR00159 family)